MGAAKRKEGLEEEIKRKKAAQNKKAEGGE